MNLRLASAAASICAFALQVWMVHARAAAAAIISARFAAAWSSDLALPSASSGQAQPVPSAWEPSALGIGKSACAALRASGYLRGLSFDGSVILEGLDVIAKQPGIGQARRPEQHRGLVTDFDGREDEKSSDELHLLLGGSSLVDEFCAG